MAQLQRVVVAPSQMGDRQVVLTSAQQRYLLRVLRLQAGDRFIVMDGRQWWLALLHGEVATLLEVLAVQTELPVATVLLVAVPKQGMEDIVRQTTELGVSAIVPILSNRVVLNPSPQKVDRWRRILYEAAEQSERQIVPTLYDPLPFQTAIDQWNSATTQSYVCEARGNLPHLLNSLTAAVPNQPIGIATGPEGGWTGAEIAGAIEAGYQPVSLGRRILRAVTAPGVALSLVGSYFESLADPSPEI